MRHIQVGNDEFRNLGFQLQKSIEAVFCGCNLVSFNGQRRRDHGANAGIVIDDEYPILRRVEQWCLLAATNTTATKISHLEVGDDGSLSFSICQCCSKLHTSAEISLLCRVYDSKQLTARSKSGG